MAPRPIAALPVTGPIPGPLQPKRPLTITVFGEFDDKQRATVVFGIINKKGAFTPTADPEVDPHLTYEAEIESIVVPTFINNTAAEGDRFVKVSQGGQHGISPKKVITLEK